MHRIQLAIAIVNFYSSKQLATVANKHFLKQRYRRLQTSFSTEKVEEPVNGAFYVLIVVDLEL